MSNERPAPVALQSGTFDAVGGGVHSIALQVAISFGGFQSAAITSISISASILTKHFRMPLEKNIGG